MGTVGVINAAMPFIESTKAARSVRRERKA